MSASSARPELPQGMKMFRLSAPTRRIVTTLAVKEVKTVADSWVLGDLPGVSAMHAVDLFWKNVVHRRPALLSREGVPVSQTRLKRSEITVREIEVADCPIA